MTQSNEQATSAKQTDSAQFWGGALATIAIILFSSWLAVYWQPGREARARVEIKDFNAKVELGQSIDDAHKAFERGGYSLLTWSERHKPFYVVKTPNEAGAYNWVTWLETADGKIVAIRTRQWDHPSKKPEESPEDRVVKEQSRWQEVLSYRLDY